MYNLTYPFLCSNGWVCVPITNWAECEHWKPIRERQTERGGCWERNRCFTPTLSWLLSLHRQEVSPAPSLPRILMQPRLPGNRLRGVSQSLTTRSICDRGRDEGWGSPLVCFCEYSACACVCVCGHSKCTTLIIYPLAVCVFVCVDAKEACSCKNWTSWC